MVDVESSGLNQRTDCLISIGAVALVNGRIDPQDAFEVVLKQSRVSDTKNILLHGIGAEAQREGVEPQEALLSFLEFVGQSPLVAHHADFDQGMINRAMRSFLGYELRQVWLDLAWILPELFNDKIDGNATLDQWLAQFKIPNVLRHNAVADAYATAQLLQVALQRATVFNWNNAMALIEAEKSRRWMRRAR